jgi:hypothetical protein
VNIFATALVTSVRARAHITRNAGEDVFPTSGCETIIGLQPFGIVPNVAMTRPGRCKQERGKD